MASDNRRPLSPSQRRLMFGGAAVIALIVTVIFLTIGDGVDVPDASGIRAFIVDCGHTAVWVLLSIAFAIAAAAAKWTRVSQAVAVTAGVIYVAFLLSVFVAY